MDIWRDMERASESDFILIYSFGNLQQLKKTECSTKWSLSVNYHQTAVITQSF